MKIAVAILFFTAVFVLAAEQESPPTCRAPFHLSAWMSAWLQAHPASFAQLARI
jgi:hypothetical protein